MEPQIMFAHKQFNERVGQFEFWDIEKDPRTTALYSDESIFKVSVREATEGEETPYWGWFDNKDQDYSMIYPAWVLYSMCFPYGPKAEEERGRGRSVQLIIEELELYTDSARST